MSSITTQQTKLDLELVPKENRLDIGKCNGRIPRGLTPREPTFQVVLDAIALTLCYLAFLITADVPEICPRVPGRDFDALPSEEDTMSFLRELGHTREINSLNDVVVDQIHQPWRTYAALINRGLFGKTIGLDKLRLSKAQILWESTQIYGAILPKCLTSPAMKESKAYKTYLGYATGVVPPKIARKFKKPSPSKKDSDLVPVDEEPITKSKQVKRSVKKSSTKPAAGVVIREAHVETKSKSKEKKKSLRDFHKTYPSGSGTIAEKPQSVNKITPTVTSEGTGDKLGVPNLTEDDSTKSESESWENDEDDRNNEQESSNEGSKQENESDEQESDSEQEEESEDDDQEEEEFVHTPTNDKDDDNLESESDDVIKSDEEKGMDDTT
ncbi:hypothetical protein Tco_0851286, partial [Tanacetum coccineum]